MDTRGAELWKLFKEYKDTPLEYSLVVSQIDNVYLEISEQDDWNLGEAILFNTRNIDSIRHLIANGVDFAGLSYMVLFEWYTHTTSDEMYDMMVALNLPAEVFSDSLDNTVLPTTAVKCAIIGNHHRWLRVLFEYGCQLPLYLPVPDWVTKLEIEVRQRKRRCKETVLLILGIARFRRRSQRDTIGIIARQVSGLWREDEWLLLVN